MCTCPVDAQRIMYKIKLTISQNQVPSTDAIHSHQAAKCSGGAGTAERSGELDLFGINRMLHVSNCAYATTKVFSYEHIM